MKTLVIIIVFIIILLILYKQKPNKKKVETKQSIQLDLSENTEPSPELLELVRLNAKVQDVVNNAGYEKKYDLASHPTKSFMRNKKELYVCTSCANGDDEKLLYIGLHEVAHGISTSSGRHSHDEEWKGIFMNLLNTAARLGYLDQNKIR